MASKVTTIIVPFVLNVSVNCYLVRDDDGFVLLDTGTSAKRSTVEAALASAGCQPGNLKLIAMTHGDFDHCGNAAYLREKFGAKIVMHEDDLGIAERGDFFWNRKQPNVVVRALFGLIFRLNDADRFTPDAFIREGDHLAAYGFDARVIEIPGHSKGSVGFLTPDSDLFCGDLLANTSKPGLWSIIDDRAAANASVEKLKQFQIGTVYPGHGRQFPMSALVIA